MPAAADVSHLHRASRRARATLPPMLPLGARYMLLAAFAFSLMTLFVKLAGQRLPAQEIVAVRAALTLLFSYVALRKAGLPPLGSGRPLLWVRGLCGFSALSCV